MHFIYVYKLFATSCIYINISYIYIYIYAWTLNHLHEGTLSSPPGSPRPLLNKFRYGGVKLYTWEPFYTWSAISTTTIKGIRLVTTEHKGNLVPITEYRHDKHEHRTSIDKCLSRAMHKSDWTACMSAFFPQEMIDRQTRQLSNTVHRIGHWPMFGSTDPKWSTHNIQVRRQTSQLSGFFLEARTWKSKWRMLRFSSLP